MDHRGPEIISATEFLHNYGIKWSICIERIVDIKIPVCTMSLGSDSYLVGTDGDETVTGVGKKVMNVLMKYTLKLFI